MLYLIIGRREQGKTTLMYHMSGRIPQRVIFDPRGLMRRPGSVKAQTPAELTAAVEALEDGEITEVTFTPVGNVQAGFETFAAELQRWQLAQPERPLAICIDELSFIDTRVDAFQWVLRCCRRDTTQVLLTAHRPKDIQTDVRAIADHWILFACRQEHDLKVIAERCGDDTVRAVERLQPRQFVHWDDTVASFRVFSDPSSWHVPLDPVTGRHKATSPGVLDELPHEPGRTVVLKPQPLDTPKLFS